MGDRLDTTDKGRKEGAAVPLLGVGILGPHLTQCGMGRAAADYLYAKFHLDLSNRLATIHQRHRQDRQTGQRSDRKVNRFTNGCPKMEQPASTAKTDFVNWRKSCS